MRRADAETLAESSGDLLRRLWIEAVNETAATLGPSWLIPLSRESIVGDMPLTAQSSEAVDVLLRSLREEAGLSGVGLLFARIELLRAVRARSVLSRASQGLSAAHPGPSRVVFIAGFARCGTSALQQALAAQAGFHAPMTAHVLYPESIGSPMGSWIQSVTSQDKLWDLADPCFSRLHVNRGDLPAECLPILSAAFTSNHWTGCYRVPSYAEHLAGIDIAEALGLHRTFAFLIASASGARCLVFKAPTHILRISEILAAYPSARIVVIDREIPLSLNSHWRLLRSLRSMRSAEANDALDLQDAVKYFQSAYGALSAGLHSGLLSANNLCVVSAESLEYRPDTVMAQLCEWLGAPAGQVVPSAPAGRLGRNGLAEPSVTVPAKLVDKRRAAMGQAREAGVLYA
jgi:Sulfotransferase family